VSQRVDFKCVLTYLHASLNSKIYPGVIRPGTLLKVEGMRKRGWKGGKRGCWSEG